MSAIATKLRPRASKSDLQELRERILDTEALLAGMKANYQDMLSSQEPRLFTDDRLIDVIVERTIEDQSEPGRDWME